MADVDINKFRASVVREGSKPASPGFIVSEGQSPTDPAGSGQNHLPVTIATAATGLSITESQVLGGAGTTGQYIRGDGSLADFPSSSGGGSSVSYYLNGSVSQGTIGGIAYKELNKVPILGAGTDFTINADGYIASFITDSGDPNLLEIPGGNWNFETYFSASSSGGSPSFYVELYKVNSGGTATLIASNSTFPELIAFGTNIISYFSTLAVPTTALALTDRLAIRYYVTHSGRTITLHTEDNHLCQIITTFTTGLTALNGLTAQIQNFAVGTSGTDFAIASATATHTFNLPTASATNRGALSSADWTTFNNKANSVAGGYLPLSGGTMTGQIIMTTGTGGGIRFPNDPFGGSSDTSGIRLITRGGETMSLEIFTTNDADDWVNIVVPSNDSAKVNGNTIWHVGNITPVTGTGTTNYLSKFTGASTIGNSLIFDNGSSVGINTATPGNYILALNYTGANLSVLSIQNSSSTGYSGLHLLNNSGGVMGHFGYANASTSVFTDAVFFGSIASKAVIFTTADSEKMRIFAGGNVHIGTTPSSDNGARLQVSGEVNINSGATRALRIDTNNGVQGISLSPNSIFGIDEPGVSNGRFIINTSGFVGIANNSPSFRLDVSGTGRYFQNNSSLGNATGITLQQSGSGDIAISYQLTGVREWLVGIDNSDADTFKINNITGSGDFNNVGLAITTGGNVGIGTDSPKTLLDVFANTDIWHTFIGGSTSKLLIGGQAGSGGVVLQAGNASIPNNAAPSTTYPLILQRDGGNVLIGTSSQLQSTERLAITTSSNTAILAQYTGGATSGWAAKFWNNATSGDNLFIEFVTETSITARGSVTYNRGSGVTAYNTTSDYRIKTEISDFNSLNIISNLKPQQFRIGNATRKTIGFIAHELQEFFPQAVTGIKDQIDNFGNPIYQSVDYSQLTGLLVKAIQELKQEIDTLKN